MIKPFFLKTEKVGNIFLYASLSNKGIILVPLAGEDEGKLRVYSKMLRDSLESVPGVAKVDLDGYRDEEIRVSIIPDK